ncbi:hypothetical protein DIPPA_10596 [Diplonema papillatum]|nr:hypothetical protein DIPPA_10596 [Diplonema papillatum]
MRTPARGAFRRAPQCSQVQARFSTEKVVPSGAGIVSTEEYPLFRSKIPRWVRKTAVMWHTVVDSEREEYLRNVCQSRWKLRFEEQQLSAMQRSQENWHNQRGDVEPDEPCYKQTARGIPGFHMGDRIWPIAMLNANVIYVSVFLKSLTLVLVPGSALNPIAEEVMDQCLVPLAYWNPKTDVKPFTIPGISHSTPSDVKPYWILSFVDGTEAIVLFEDDTPSKYEAIYHLQQRIHELDKVDRKKYLPIVTNAKDVNGWVRVKSHGLDSYTINEHAPLRYV